MMFCITQSKIKFSKIVYRQAKEWRKNKAMRIVDDGLSQSQFLEKLNNAQKNKHSTNFSKEADF